MRLVADANVLLAAVFGGRAKALFGHPAVEEVFAAEMTIAEAQEYAARLAIEKRLSLDVVLLAAASLPVIVVERTTASCSSSWAVNDCSGPSSAP